MKHRTRIPAAEINGISGVAVKRFSMKKLGKVPESLGVMWHNQPVLKAMAGFSQKAERWNECDHQLKAFAHMVVVAKIGCSFCLDFAYLNAHNENLDMVKARDVLRWRESRVFTSLERDVLEYAEAMTESPPAVTDELSARLLDQLGAPALVELSAFIGASNMAARTNVALGIESEGFAEAKGLAPLAVPSAVPSLA